MINYIKKALSVSLSDEEIYKEIIHYEAKLGGRLFGKIPPNHRREFFCLDEHTWVWYEETVDKNGKRQNTTVRYDVRPNGIFKVQENLVHRRLSDEELKNFYLAVKLYGQKIPKELLKLVPANS